MLWFKKRQGPVLPGIAAGVRVYAVGDVHGRADLLGEMFAKIDTDVADRPADRIVEVFLGDYIDRGPASNTVIERLATPPSGRERICLSGNHEQLMRDFIDRPDMLSSWRNVGGLSTLAAYGLEPYWMQPPVRPELIRDRLLQLMPERHFAFLNDLPLKHVIDSYVFVHAGLRPGVSLEQQSEADLMGIRDTFHRSTKPFEHFVVHGHTPVIEPEICVNRINIDTGAFATGRLTCLVLEGTERRFITAGRVRTAAAT